MLVGSAEDYAPMFDHVASGPSLLPPGTRFFASQGRMRPVTALLCLATPLLVSIFSVGSAASDGSTRSACTALALLSL